MNFLQRLVFKAAQAVIPNPIFQAMAGMYGAEQPQRMANNYGTFAKEGYRADATCYKCISYLSRNAAQVDWGLYSDRFLRNEIESHPLLDLLDRPNPDQNRADFVEDWSGTLLLSGNGFMKSEYISQSFTLTTPPDAIYVLRPDWTDVVPGQNGIIGYQFGANTYEKTPIPPFQVAHTKYWCPDDQLRGLSPVEVASIFIDLQTAGNKWNLALMQNSARPPGTWTTDQILTKTDYDKLKDDLAKKYQGYKNAGTPPVLYGGLKWTQMSMSPAELDWLNSRMRNAADIANLYNLAPMLIGDTSASTYNNMDQAKLASYLDAIFPMVLNKLQAAWNRWLVPKFGDPKNLFLAYKPESVASIQAVIQQQLAAQADRATKIYMSGGINMDEYREACGYQPLQGGAGQVRRIGGILVRDADIIIYAQQALQKPAAPPALVPENILDNPPPGGNNGNPEPADGKPEANADNSENDTGGKSHRLLPARFVPQRKVLDLQTAEQKQAYVESLEAQRKEWETEVQQRLQAYFKQEQQLVVAAVDQAAIPSSAIDRAELAIKQLQPHLTDVISGIWQDVASDVGTSTAKQLKSSDRRYQHKTADFIEKMLEYMLNLSAKKVQEIDEFTLWLLQTVLSEGIDQGDSIPDLAKRVDNLYLDQIIPNRSQTIAATEVCAASNWGSQQAASQSGLTLTKEWVATNDGHTRVAHAEANGQVVPMNQPFNVGGEDLDYPGDPNGSAENVINCRCTQVYQSVTADTGDTTSVDDGSGDNLDIEQMSHAPLARRVKYVWTPKQPVAVKSLPSYSKYKSALRKQVLNG